jgi:hypothetical protein
MDLSLVRICEYQEQSLRTPSPICLHQLVYINHVIQAIDLSDDTYVNQDTIECRIDCLHPSIPKTHPSLGAIGQYLRVESIEIHLAYGPCWIPKATLISYRISRLSRQLELIKEYEQLYFSNLAREF